MSDLFTKSRNFMALNVWFLDFEFLIRVVISSEQVSDILPRKNIENLVHMQNKQSCESMELNTKYICNMLFCTGNTIIELVEQFHSNNQEFLHADFKCAIFSINFFGSSLLVAKWSVVSKSACVYTEAYLLMCDIIISAIWTLNLVLRFNENAICSGVSCFLLFANSIDGLWSSRKLKICSIRCCWGFEKISFPLKIKNFTFKMRMWRGVFQSSNTMSIRFPWTETIKMTMDTL